MMRAAAFCLLAALQCALAGPQGQRDQSSPGYPAYQRANSLFVAKKVPEALSALEQSLQLDEKLMPALTLYARIAMTMNRFDAARESLQRALMANPDAAYPRFLYGLSFYLTNDLQQALPQFVKARLANPKDARAALYLGLTYESLGRITEALPLYQESAHLEPGSEALLAGARLLHLTGRLEEAERWLQTALQRDPASRDVHFELARLLLRNAQVVRAAEEGERALALPGGTVSDTQIHYLLSGAYRDNEPLRATRHAEAVKALENSGAQ